jgi:hypothetical protein
MGCTLLLGRRRPFLLGLARLAQPMRRCGLAFAAALLA